MKRILIIISICLMNAFICTSFCGCVTKTEAVYDIEEKSAEEVPAVKEVPAEDPSAAGESSVTPEKKEADVTKEEHFIVVYICGEVLYPGVYTLREDSRVFDAIQAAGGLLEDADERHLNQAQKLSDGQQITVYGIQEEISDEAYAKEQSSAVTGSPGQAKVNLNTADTETLMTLPGIGEARAIEIINYRNEHGGFSAVEEIMNISGIKEKLFEKIKDYIEI